MQRWARFLITGGLLGLLVPGCKSETPSEDTGPGDETGGDDMDDDMTGDGVDDGTGDGTGDGMDDGDSSGGADCPDLEIPASDESACAALDTDYQPQVNMSADDMYPACVTDDGTYTLVDTTPSSVARVEAYETIADLLWRNGTPDATAFTDARNVYSVDEGLESRLVRREDLHYPEVPMEDWDPGVDPDKQCTVEANVMNYPDRCAGPALLAPLVSDAFAAGQTGEGNADVHAARINATFLWFYYISAYKECNTCIATAKDCDSCWAYYTGGNDRSGGIGLAGLVRSLSDASHNAVFDGISAVRCWRDLYPIDTYPTWDDVPSEGQDLYDDAWEQLDNALHRGFALVVRDKLAEQVLACGTPEAEGNWAFLQVAGPVLDREASERDPTNAAILADLWATDAPSSEDIAAGVDALDAIFPCPQP